MIILAVLQLAHSDLQNSPAFAAKLEEMGVRGKALCSKSGRDRSSEEHLEHSL